MADARPKSTDGRVLRGARNHEAIVQALYELVREGALQPTAERVAERAGVGTRTVFRQFEDLETLFRSLGERVIAEVLALLDTTPPSGDLDADLRVIIARRARIFGFIAPFRRAGGLVRHTSTYLQSLDAMLALALHAGLTTIVGPHLRDDGGDTLEALDLLLSFESWDRLRDQRGLSRKRAERVLLKAATTLARAGARKPRETRAPSERRPSAARPRTAAEARDHA